MPDKNYQSVQGALVPPPNNLGHIPGQWQMPQQSHYANIAAENVDWATLAQQWIHMRETFPTLMPAAPPPPTFNSSQFGEEHGEAPMEVERDEEAAPAAPHWPIHSGGPPPINAEPPDRLWNENNRQNRMKYKDFQRNFS